MPTTQQQERLIKSLYDLANSEVQVTMKLLGRMGVVAGWEASAEGEEAINALRDAWSMEGKDDFVWIGDRWDGRSLSRFVEWVVIESQEAEIFDLAMKLIEFRSTAKAERVYFALVSEVWMDLDDSEYFEFHDGTVLAPIERHPDRELAEHYNALNYRPSLRDNCRLYLGFSNEEVCHFGEKPEEHDNSDFNRLRDIAMCINLCRPIDGSISLPALSNFFSAPYLEFGGRSWSMPYSRKPTMQNGLIEFELRKADELFQKFHQCSEEVKDLIRVSARYLSHMGMADPLEDKLISFRVALEAFFLFPTYTKGQRQTVSERAALLHGTNEPQRAENEKLFKKVYDSLSRTAHSGRIHKSYDREKVQCAAGKLRQSICAMIENGRGFDWDDLESKADS